MADQLKVSVGTIGYDNTGTGPLVICVPRWKLCAPHFLRHSHGAQASTDVP
jgi:hypothetical protein